MFDHGGFAHAYSLFEEVVRIPLWIKLPGQRGSATVDTPVSLLDLLPTILETADLPLPADLDGRSLVPLLGVETRPAGFRGRPIVTDTRWKSRAVASAIRLGNYKLIEIESDYEGRANTQLLFDLTTDPAEQADLATLEPDKVAALSSALARVFESGRDGLESESATGLDVDILRALGYVD